MQALNLRMSAGDETMALEEKCQDVSMLAESEGYIADDETRPGPNHLKAMESFDNEEPHPELAPMPQENKPGVFSRFGNGKVDATAPTKGGPEVQAADKGVGSSELGTGYEEDGEESVNPAIVPKYDEGVKPPSALRGDYESFGIGEVDDVDSEGSFRR